MSFVFFDLDKTLIRTQSQRLLLYTLRRNKFITFFGMLKLKVFFVAYKMHLIPHSRIETMFNIVAKLIEGLDVQHVKKVVRSFVFAEFSAIENLRAVEELEKHISAGKEIVLTSAAFEPIVEAAAEFFHIPHYTCTKLEVENGLYTGRLIGKPNYGVNKIHNLEKYDFRGSFAYSDHHSDIPLLQKATYRYAVNPTSQMRAYAKSHGWFILE